MTQLQNDLLSPADSPMDHLAESPANNATEAQLDIHKLVSRVSEIVPIVYPLKDYIAVNPMQGVIDHAFEDARTFMRTFSDCETLMPMTYYASRFAAGDFSRCDVEAALSELAGKDAIAGCDVDGIMSRLEATSPSELIETVYPPKTSWRAMQTFAQKAETKTQQHWPAWITDEVSRHAASHFDQAISTWQDPLASSSVYQTWRLACETELSADLRGLKGFRSLVANLPHSPEAAVAHLLEVLQVPQDQLDSFLLCQAFSMPGWCAWAKYHDSSQDEGAGESLVSMLAIRLAYESAIAKKFELTLDSNSEPGNEADTGDAANKNDFADDVAMRLVLLRASELAFRQSLVGKMRSASSESQSKDSSRRALAQMVFCIDVRSERYRRNLEAASDDIDTYGFAGFFGLPIEFVELGDKCGKSHVPALIQPSFQLHEGLDDGQQTAEATVVQERFVDRWNRKWWKSLQKTATSCFPFVESMGMSYAWKLIRSSSAIVNAKTARTDGLDKDDQGDARPVLRGLNEQGITTSAQVDMAESMLRGIGITDHFARLVVLCGHASQTANNPLAAGLDCGACGGHSGEPNARFGALLLNQAYVRQGLAERGIHIPEDTHFLGGLHNTTNDEITLFADDVESPEHADDVAQLRDAIIKATAENQKERALTLSGDETDPVKVAMQRSNDWSEVRPEWGLAGNAAFIVAPRDRTRGLNLGGETFLHSYDHNADPEAAVLEVVMTAPMVVANWINMQYYASSVDQQHFGSGHKTIHNVVGNFGLLAGSSGDLMTGLPIQSLHDGKRFRHAPRRLLAVIEAPRENIAAIIGRHEGLQNLIGNQWMHLVAVDGGEFYTCTYSDEQTEFAAIAP